MAWLDARDVGYENRDIEADPQSRERLVDLTGHTSVPVVVIEGQLVRGYDPERMRSLLAAR
jgi:glutaredoxin